MANLIDFPGVSYDLGPTRRLPVSEQYLQQLMGAVKATDPNLSIVMTSAGQAQKGSKGPRTGSTRHDVDHTGHSGTSDFVLVRDGKRIQPSQDKALYARFFQNAAASGFTGMGHYAWGVHVGGGSKQMWGPSTTGSDLDPIFKQAIEAGWSKAGAPRPDNQPPAPQPTFSSPTHNTAPSQFNATDASVVENPITPNHMPVSTEAPAAPKPAPYFTEIAGAALTENWSLLNLWPNIGAPAPQTGYQLNVKEELTDVPAEYHDRFIYSRSPQQTSLMRDKVMKELAGRQTIADAGWLGTAVSLGAAFTDPVEWAAGAGLTLLSGGTGLPAVLARRFGKLAGVLEGASTGAIVTATSQGILNANRTTAENADFYASVGMGLVFGGLLGLLARNPHTKKEGLLLNTAGEKVLAQGDEALRMGGSTAGAAQHFPRELNIADTADWMGISSHMPKGFAVDLRYDLAASYHKSDNDAGKLLGLSMVEDGTRYADGTTPISAAEVKTMLNRTADSKLVTAEQAAFKSWAERKQVKLTEREAKYREFVYEVSDFVENRNPHRVFDPEIEQYGSKFRTMMSDWQDLAHNPGNLDGTLRRSLPGFEENKKNPNYLPHIVDNASVRHHISTHGTAPMGKFVGKAIMKANPDITEAQAEKMGLAYIRSLDKLSAGDVAPGARPISADNVEELKAFLRAESDISDEELDSIFAVGNPTKKRNGATPRGKHRMLLDTEFAMMMNGERVVMKDLFNRNVTELGQLYNRQMSGRIAMAQMRVKNPKWKGDGLDETPQYLIDGITKDSEFDRALQIVSDYGVTVGAKKTEGTVEQLKASYDIITGKPRYSPKSKFYQALRTLRDAQYVRVMNMAGFAQIPELPQAISQVGVRAMFSNMPTFRDLWRNAKTGKLGSELSQEIEDVFGTGTEFARGTSHRRMDDFDQPLEDFANSGFMGRVNDLQRKLKTVTSVGSGMSSVNTIMQRWVGRGIFQKFGNMAMAGSVKIDKRTMGLGLDQAMLDKISSNIRKHASFDGKRVQKMNWAEWKDRDAAAAFQMAAFRFARQAVQENELGNMALWMSHPVAQTMLQFRTFQMAGWAKQTMYGLNHMDGRTIAGWTTSTFVGAMVYMARTNLTAASRSDKEEFLQKRLTVEKIALAGVQNGSWATLFPPMVDTGLTRFGHDGLFNSRTTDQPSDIWGGNPTVNFLNDASNLPGTFMDFAQGNGSQADARKAFSLVYLQNNMLIGGIFNSLVSPLRDAN